MDQLVYFIALSVLINFTTNFGVAGQNIEPSAEKVESEPFQPLVPLKTATDKPEPTNRSTLLDNIFNIPIATLKAVNELVQSIAGNLQAAGAGTAFQRTSKVKDVPVAAASGNTLKADV